VNIQLACKGTTTPKKEKSKKEKGGSPPKRENAPSFTDGERKASVMDLWAKMQTKSVVSEKACAEHQVHTIS
jgi:hypothetical protein